MTVDNTQEQNDAADKIHTIIDMLDEVRQLICEVYGSEILETMELPRETETSYDNDPYDDNETTFNEDQYDIPFDDPIPF